MHNQHTINTHQTHFHISLVKEGHFLNHFTPKSGDKTTKTQGVTECARIQEKTLSGEASKKNSN